jgi:hypothetical protein
MKFITHFMYGGDIPDLFCPLVRGKIVFPQHHPEGPGAKKKNCVRFKTFIYEAELLDSIYYSFITFHLLTEKMNPANSFIWLQVSYDYDQWRIQKFRNGEPGRSRKGGPSPK